MVSSRGGEVVAHGGEVGGFDLERSRVDSSGLGSEA